ncbi:MAG: Cysteine desulfurase NifS [Parcubacteria group bacterium GW2011_GWA1_44_13]|uniref:Cysteine desulfurase NifS n=1 Tax=Candidatus Nomurabacteria bacterium GW2011_GWB1_44_12 TaxID=1618748 RepID=A0A837I753_9BACT|nr:MAG: Cysteine desulfurase NifS [Candidatus Nomurabacteria bacterium GW2011_GWB1_44_12]KKT37487.1 MAG: Cysteine desulfurase NifS [Parcubacteria group bacterium GW2011_GWA1_44_13]
MNSDLKGYYGEMKRIYLDNAAATPVSATALRAVVEATKKFPGNPSGIHKEGRSARAVLETARASVAESVSARPDEIVFTSSATEANNLAITGTVRACGIAKPRIIVSAIEHASVLELARTFESAGMQVDYLPVDSRGLIDTKELRKLITPETALVSIMYANNEIGTIEPIIDITKEIRHARKMNGSAYPYFHTDASQAGNYLDINVLRLGVDLMTVSSGKTYGPRGIGALFVKRGVNLHSQMYGGEHEGGRRPGTEAVALACGFAEALEEAQKMSVKEGKRVAKLRDTLAMKILKKVSGASVNGSLEHSLPNILNISFEGVESEALVLYLDASGIAVSGKSACKSSDGGPSHVILAIGEANEGESGAIRFSLGREINSEDITRVANEVIRLIPLLRIMQTNSN